MWKMVGCDNSLIPQSSSWILWFQMILGGVRLTRLLSAPAACYRTPVTSQSGNSSIHDLIKKVSRYEDGVASHNIFYKHLFNAVKSDILTYQSMEIDACLEQASSGHYCNCRFWHFYADLIFFPQMLLLCLCTIVLVNRKEDHKVDKVLNKWPMEFDACCPYG